MKQILKVFLGFLIALFVLKPFALKAQNEYINGFATSNLSFDFSSIEAIVFTPEKIVENPNEFWQKDSAYVLAKHWHDATKVPILMNKWTKKIQKLSKQTDQERRQSATMQIVDILKKEEKNFVQLAIPHIVSFLPSQTPSINTKIFITAYTNPWAFAVKGFSVVSITDKHYQQNAEFILNLMIHEFFHVGYAKNAQIWKETALIDDAKSRLIIQLHNEGMATYIAYTAQNLYSAKGFEPDFKMFENQEIIAKKIQSVNEIFKKANVNSNTISDLSWKVGIMQRAYYVAGAFMAKMIDEKLGRKILAATIENGPRSFVATYNSIADEDKKIIELVD